jgi:flavodoxin
MATNENGSTKVLIIYYSRSGNTREIANQINKRLAVIL